MEWPSILCEVCTGLMMELVSETMGQVTLPAGARDKACCRLMFAAPTRDRAVMSKESYFNAVQI